LLCCVPARIYSTYLYTRRRMCLDHPVSCKSCTRRWMYIFVECHLYGSAAQLSLLLFLRVVMCVYAWCICITCRYYRYCTYKFFFFPSDHYCTYCCAIATTVLTMSIIIDIMHSFIKYTKCNILYVFKWPC